MIRELHADRERYRRRRASKQSDFIWLKDGLIPLVTYRLGRWIQDHRRSWIHCPLCLILLPVRGLLTVYTRLVYDIEIDAASAIAGGFYIGHFGGIRVRNCRIEEGCSIHQEVRLLPLEAGQAGPRIGRRVWIGAHAQVSGPVCIGDGVTIGAGAMVTSDVEPGCLVLGNPARVVRRNYDNSSIL